jgi:hypothetical protein
MVKFCVHHVFQVTLHAHPFHLRQICISAHRIECISIFFSQINHPCPSCLRSCGSLSPISFRTNSEPPRVESKSLPGVTIFQVIYNSWSCLNSLFIMFHRLHDTFFRCRSNQIQHSHASSQRAVVTDILRSHQNWPFAWAGSGMDQPIRHLRTLDLHA